MSISVFNLVSWRVTDASGLEETEGAGAGESDFTAELISGSADTNFAAALAALLSPVAVPSDESTAGRADGEFRLTRDEPIVNAETASGPADAREATPRLAGDDTVSAAPGTALGPVSGARATAPSTEERILRQETRPPAVDAASTIKAVAAESEALPIAPPVQGSIVAAITPQAVSPLVEEGGDPRTDDALSVAVRGSGPTLPGDPGLSAADRITSNSAALRSTAAPSPSPSPPQSNLSLSEPEPNSSNPRPVPHLRPAAADPSSVPPAKPTGRSSLVQSGASGHGGTLVAAAEDEFGAAALIERPLTADAPTGGSTLGAFEEVPHPLFASDFQITPQPAAVSDASGGSGEWPAGASVVHAEAEFVGVHSAIGRAQRTSSAASEHDTAVRRVPRGSSASLPPAAQPSLNRSAPVLQEFMPAGGTSVVPAESSPVVESVTGATLNSVAQAPSLSVTGTPVTGTPVIESPDGLEPVPAHLLSIPNAARAFVEGPSPSPQETAPIPPLGAPSTAPSATIADSPSVGENRSIVIPRSTAATPAQESRPAAELFSSPGGDVSRSRLSALSRIGTASGPKAVVPPLGQSTSSSSENGVSGLTQPGPVDGGLHESEARQFAGPTFAAPPPAIQRSRVPTATLLLSPTARGVGSPPAVSTPPATSSSESRNGSREALTGAADLTVNVNVPPAAGPVVNSGSGSAIPGDPSPTWFEPGAQLIEATLSRMQIVRLHGQGDFDLRLTPPELGTLHVSLRQTRRGLSVRVLAESGRTQELLEASRAEIVQALAGEQSGGIELDIGARQQRRESSPPELIPLPDWSDAPKSPSNQPVLVPPTSRLSFLA